MATSAPGGDSKLFARVSFSSSFISYLPLFSSRAQGCLLVYFRA